MTQTATAREDIAQTAIRLIAERGRMTSQRRTIIEQAVRIEGPYTAETLYEQARRRNPRVSRATVYRTLPLLLDTGLLRKIHLDQESALYEANLNASSQHSFIWCLDCEQMIPFDDYCLHLREGALIRQLGFRAEDVRLRVDARCEEYQRTGACPRSQKGGQLDVTKD